MRSISFALRVGLGEGHLVQVLHPETQDRFKFCPVFVFIDNCVSGII